MCWLGWLVDWFDVLCPSQQLVSSPNHTFFWASFTKPLTSTLCTYFRIYRQQAFLNQRKEENDRSNYFMINLYKRMGLGEDQTRNPWICNQIANDCSMVAGRFCVCFRC